MTSTPSDCDSLNYDQGRCCFPVEEISDSELYCSSPVPPPVFIYTRRQLLSIPSPWGENVRMRLALLSLPEIISRSPQQSTLPPEPDYKHQQQQPISPATSPKLESKTVQVSIELPEEREERGRSSFRAPSQERVRYHGRQRRDGRQSRVRDRYGQGWRNTSRGFQ